MIAEIETERVEQAISEFAAGQDVTREDIDAILLDYDNYIGVEDLVLDENQTVALNVEDDVELSLVYLPQFPGIVAVAELDPELREQPALLRHLLQANMSWESTQGGCFGVIPGSREVVLCRLIALGDRDLERIDAELAAFAQTAEVWQQELDLALLADSEPEAGEIPFGSGYLRP